MLYPTSLPLFRAAALAALASALSSLQDQRGLTSIPGTFYFSDFRNLSNSVSGLVLPPCACGAQAAQVGPRPRASTTLLGRLRRGRLQSASSVWSVAAPLRPSGLPSARRLRSASVSLPVRSVFGFAVAVDGLALLPLPPSWECEGGVGGWDG